MTNDRDMQAVIRSLVSEGVVRLDDHLRAWVENHLIDPYPEAMRHLGAGEGSEESVEVWFVTADTGSEDSAYRVVYDPTSGLFGLTVNLQDGTTEFMGLYGDFVDAVENM